ncbi:hypothetical protein [Kitasatospora sp. GAS1066B]
MNCRHRQPHRDEEPEELAGPDLFPASDEGGAAFLAGGTVNVDGGSFKH